MSVAGIPPPPPMVPLVPKAVAAEDDGRAALFASINKGTDITSGLKKVRRWAGVLLCLFFLDVFYYYFCLIFNQFFFFILFLTLIMIVRCFLLCRKCSFCSASCFLFVYFLKIILQKKCKIFEQSVRDSSWMCDVQDFWGSFEV